MVRAEAPVEHEQQVEDRYANENAQENNEVHRIALRRCLCRNGFSMDFGRPAHKGLLTTITPHQWPAALVVVAFAQRQARPQRADDVASSLLEPQPTDDTMRQRGRRSG